MCWLRMREEGSIRKLEAPNGLFLAKIFRPACISELCKKASASARHWPPLSIGFRVAGGMPAPSISLLISPPPASTLNKLYQLHKETGSPRRSDFFSFRISFKWCQNKNTHNRKGSCRWYFFCAQGLIAEPDRTTLERVGTVVQVGTGHTLWTHTRLPLSIPVRVTPFLRTEVWGSCLHNCPLALCLVCFTAAAHQTLLLTMDTPSNGVGTILTSDKCLSARSRTQTSPGLNTSFLLESFMNSGLRVAVNRYKTISFSLEAFFLLQIATKSKSLNGCLSHLNIFFLHVSICVCSTIFFRCLWKPRERPPDNTPQKFQVPRCTYFLPCFFLGWREANPPISSQEHNRSRAAFPAGGGCITITVPHFPKFHPICTPTLPQGVQLKGHAKLKCLQH